MRVMVTGGTGFVGGHIVRALVDEGHEPCMLVRSEPKLRQLVELFDLPGDIAWSPGDILDAASVASALEGADACVHAAAFTTLDPNEMDRCLEVNGPGTEIVLGAAVEARCDPIVHLSSISCIFPPIGDVADPDVDPVHSSDAPYSKSKVESELHARALQEAGHPVVIVYPGGVTGPDDLGLNVVSSYFVNILSSDVLMIGPSGGWAVIDVRDLARAVARLMRPGMGPRRFMAQGDLMTFDDFNATLNAVTGLDRSSAAMTREDLLQVMDEEAVDIQLEIRPANDGPLQRETGVTWRPQRDTLQDTVRWLVANRYLDEKWAPALGAAS
jgi:nucleoside-diphosphate-sugar epimerase